MSDRDAERFLRALATDDLLIGGTERETFKTARRAARRDLDRHPFVQLDRRARAPQLLDLGRRRSERLFTSRPVSFSDLSSLLSALDPEPSSSGPVRRYASAGGAYAVQLYVQVHATRVDGVLQGSYYYDADRRRLVFVQDEPVVRTDDHFPANRPWVDRGAFTMLLVADLSTIRPVYGAMARDFCLLEAGEMSQLLQGVASSLNLGLCQSGVVDFDRVRAGLLLGADHEVLAALVGGAVDRDRVTADAQLHDAGQVGRRPPAPIDREPGVMARHDVQDAIEVELLSMWKTLLGTDELDPTAPFFDLGATSIMAARAVRDLQERYPDAGLDVTDIFAFPTVRELACRLSQGQEQERTIESEAAETTAPATIDDRATSGSSGKSSDGSEPVAIVGVAIRVSGASTVDAFWDLLAEGRCQVGPQPEARRVLVPRFQVRNDQLFTGSYLSDLEQFDARFFHMSPREAERTDPAQRLALELTADLLASSGYLGGQLAGTRTGVYLGASRSDYAELRRSGSSDLTRLLSGNMGAIIANRVSHFFDLSGPSVVIDTACSSSLVAVDQAVRAVQSGDVDAAIAGGVNVLLSPDAFEAFRQDGMESPTGQCRTFDAGADGFVRGEGAAVILLKKSSDAVRDGDHIFALIRGTASNHDGRTNSLRVPSPIAQRNVIELAHARARTTPAEIDYVEAHSTGAKLGDPVEIRGLVDAFANTGAPAAGCALGSVKPNLGHLEFAAGIVGLVKATLALERRRLPPSLHFVEPNPHIDFEATPFWVVDRLHSWPARQRRLRAAVSSFGAGGSNAHVIVEEAPDIARPMSAAEHPACLVTLSAGDEATVAAAATELVRHARGHPEIDVADLAYTMNVGRPALRVRTALVVRDRDQLIDRLTLAAFAPGGALPSGAFVGTVEVDGALGVDTERRIRALAARLTADGSGGLARYVRDERLRALLGPSIAPEDSLHPVVCDPTLWTELLAVLGELWVRGFAVDLHALDRPGERRRVPVPGLSFKRERCWWRDLDLDRRAIDEAPNTNATTRLKGGVPAPAARSEDGASSERTDHDTPREIVKDQIVALLRTRIGSALDTEPDQLDPRAPLIEMGLDSLAATELMRAVRESTGQEIDTSFFFEHPTIAQLADALIARGVNNVLAAPAVRPAPAVPPPPPRAAPVASAPKPSDRGDDSDLSRVAVVGMAGRLPGAPDLSRFWLNLRQGFDAITEVPASRFDIDAIFDPDPRSKRGSYGRWGGFLDGIDRFDPGFFRIADREARSMDPQQRILLMTVWHAVEDAGLGRRLAGSRTGVYVGASYTHHRDRMVQEGYRLEDAHAALDNNNAILANRLSYFLDLRGPCLTVDTLCSSSLVALHAAVRALRSGEIDRAIVAGVNVALSPSYFEFVSRLGALSPDGRCRAFDTGANGYVPGEGAIAIVLEPLHRAIAEGSHIHAVVLGTAVNHGGRSAGLTVPNPAAQADVVRAALDDAGVGGESLSYVEAHGTGTALGDPVEVSGLRDALSAATTRRQFCGIGSLKSSIGHLEPAAGVASVVKVILAMQHRLLPPTLHLLEPNHAIRFEDGPCYIVDRLRPWRTQGPRRAGVSSFGIGGTNAHTILEEAPPRAPRHDESAVRPWLFVVSARDDRALRAQVENYLEFVRSEGRDCSLKDLCWSAADGRAHFPRRVAIVADSIASLERQLAGAARALRTGSPIARPDGPAIEDALARTFLDGGDIDPSGLFPGARRIPLPLYPFDARQLDAHVERSAEPPGHPFASLLQPTNGASPGTQAFVVHLTAEGAG